MRLVAYGHVTGGGGAGSQAGSSPEEKPSEVGGPGGGGDNGECAAVPRGGSVRAAGLQRRARRRACREGARSGEA